MSRKLASQFQIFGHAINVEPLDAGVKVDQARRDAADGDNRQTGPLALLPDQQSFLDVDIQRVRKNIDGIETEFLRLVNSPSRFTPRLSPGRVNQSQLHFAFQ